ncbi:GTP-binding protein HSR1-related protein [Chondrocystis sp. NIES-4102]|nr:GTP-binding protein HSR1-related protein [Chondrocystis sp. NIES-4102]
MLYNSHTASEQIDYSFLLIVHLICADQQIHSQEIKYLNTLSTRPNVSQQTKDEMNKILTQDKDHLTLANVAQLIPINNRLEVMQQILEIAYADGYLASSEKEMLEGLANLWNWSSREIDRMITKVERSKHGVNKNSNSDRSQLSLAAKLFRHEQKSALSRAVIDVASIVAPEIIGRKVERLERQILLSGPEYDQAIEECCKVAQEDYQYAELAYKKTESTLKTAILSLKEVMLKVENKNSRATTAKEVANQLEESIKYLDSQIIQELDKVKESHQAKHRALSYFTIAFMGRTKAGKSTLHSIITQDGWESIGLGKQRTTRFNRIYEWKNIRIIDTPGIGAAEEMGKDDEEIAKSIIDEADVICYVVTNDSIQETEFNFLKLLKEKAKPLIILLNIKYNLRDSKRLQYFLQNPNKLFAKDGNSGIGGHIERIKRYANQHYTNDYFEIVPVMLLAAQLSSEIEHQKDQDKLYKASRIQDFLDSIRESLIKHGKIRRSQTFLGSTVGSIIKPVQWITQQKQAYQKFSNTLKSKQEKIQKDLRVAQKDGCNYLEHRIQGIFQEVINSIPSFAENNWSADEVSLNRAWKQNIETLRLEKKIQILNKEAADKFNEEIKESLAEVGRELQVVSALTFNSFNLNSQDSFDYQKLLKIGGGIIAALGLGLSFVVPPVGIAVGLLGTGLNLISNLLTSKEKKRRQAVEKISNSLKDQVEQQKRSITKQLLRDYEQFCISNSMNIDKYFQQLIAGLDDISHQLEAGQKSLDATVNYLNYGYGKRIIDWASDQYEPLTMANVKKIINKIERNFGQRMIIQSKTEIKLKKSLTEIKLVIQEDIAFER